MIRTVVYFSEALKFGGAEEMMLILMAGLDRSRWRPILVHRPVPAIAALTERAREMDVGVWPLPRLRIKRDITWVPWFVRRLRAERPQVFHAISNESLDCTYGIWSALLARVPAIITAQHLLAEEGRHRRIFQQRMRAAAVDRYIAVSDSLARDLRMDCRIPARKIQVIRNGIPLGRFQKPADPSLRASLGGGEGRPIVLTIARLHAQKGLQYLVEAAARVPHALFAVAGEGAELSALEAQVRALKIGDRFFFLGQREDIPDLLASCDLFVLPSLWEGHPVSVLEAMAAGKPVIATAIGGTDEAVVHGKTGLLVPPRDPEALAAAIRAVLSDRELAGRLAAAGRARAYEEFSVEPMVARTTEAYENVLSAKGAW